MAITFEDIRKSDTVRAYIEAADQAVAMLGYTEHSFAHVGRVAREAAHILEQLGYDERLCELTRIAAYMHDIGNVVNRSGHAHHGALMAFRLLDELGMDPAEIAVIVSAIGYHDEASAFPVSPVASVVIIADKCDVRRSRVRQSGDINADIHDRVNYAVDRSGLDLDPQARTLTLNLHISTERCPLMEYFEIFLDRMLLCRRAATQLGLTFHINMNETVVL